MTASVPFDRALRHDQLVGALRLLAADRPDLCELSVVGQSHQGRDLWLATITNTATGPAAEKPGVWVDGNIHGAETVASVAALFLIHHLISSYGHTDQETRALDTRAFYVLARVNPDGAEWALADRPRFVRSTLRPWPHADQQDGLVPQDIDGDGRVLSMRIPDANGPWKAWPGEPRLLVARDADEDGPGPYYRLLPEGLFHNFDGVRLPAAPPLYGLDVNRNFPANWRPPDEQAGAGDHPVSEPEVRAVVSAVLQRPNVCAYIAYHSMAGVHVRPFTDRPDDQLPPFDARTYEALGRRATSLTGYPVVSGFHGFRYASGVTTGGAADWAYDHLGVHAWTTELWSAPKAAGIVDHDPMRWFDEHPVEDDLALLAWSDGELGGRGYADWYPFDHPQLGRVDLGGWDAAFCWRNPPPHLMEAEVASHARFAVHLALVSPLLRLRSVEADAAGPGLWRIRLAVENAGWLPTNVTRQALVRGVVGPAEARIVLPAGAELVAGQPRVELGQLTGRALKSTPLSFGASDFTTDVGFAEWVVRVGAGAACAIEASHARAGLVRATVTLDDRLESN